MRADPAAPEAGDVMTQYRTSWVVAIVGALWLCVILVGFVPWHPVPGGTQSLPEPSRYFSEGDIDRGEEFAREARVWQLSSLAVSLVFVALLGFTRLGAALMDRLRGPWWTRVPLAVITIAVVGRVVTLPFAIAMRRHRLDFELARGSWGGFAVDVVVSELVEMAVASFGLLVVVGAARRWRRAWPAVAGGVLALSVGVGSLLYPVVVEPLFNSFSSLPEGPLRTEVLQLADRMDVNVDDVLVADASRRTTTINAYVSGFGPTRRVVVYDNLVDDLGEPETLSVVAHELAHAKNPDVLIGTSSGAAGLLLATGLLGLVLRRRPQGNGLADARAVPRVLALVAVASALVSPVEAAISQRIEARADVEALQVSSPAAFIALQQELARRSAADLTPPAWSQFWFSTHPTTLARIANAERQAAE
ncbi:MAG: M48 family metalloprotease [Nocardioides sp.]|uniref:M48 family metalloprotease n=2 Tax=Nocardioides sp. TaxID=35761 RepID=UPI0023A03827|nr:M48 family metalloprotease [Nocardioides sp.]MDE0776767.1 M48 family metalloprotease [Nocardioides sp.]